MAAYRVWKNQQSRGEDFTKVTRMTINETNYNVMRWGDGIPLVLLHGFTGSAASWEPIARRLSEHYQVIAVDLLGHGHSDKPCDVHRYSMERVACDLMKLFGNLFVGQAHVLGYSMGGRLALYMAVHFPELFRTLTLESASPGLKTADERDKRVHHDRQLAESIEQYGVAAFVDSWEQLPLWSSQKTLPDDVKLAQRKQRLQNDATGLANSLRGMGTGVQPSLWDMLTNIEIPTHLIVGEHDAKFRQINEETVKLLSSVNYSLIVGAGHNTHLEQPDQFVHHTLRFISQW